jgi:hypothetical protein
MAASTTTTNQSYRWHRARGFRAVDAIHSARMDQAAGTRRYASSPTVSYGPATAVHGERHCRYIENVADGLRFVGHADDIAGRAVDHNGWYLSDDNWTGESVRGAVWQLPARNGRPRFVAGYADPYNGNAESDGAACLSFDEIFEGEPGDGLPRHNDGAREAAIRADGIAESMAESEREYQAASSARFEFGELAEEIGATRRQTLSIIRELKRLAKKISATEAAESCAALRAVISRNVKKIRQARKRHEELLNEFGQRPGFNDV